METKSKDNKIESLKRSCGFQKGTLVGSVGGLSLWWDDNIDLEVKGFSKKFIDTSITDNQRGMHYRASWVYGMPYREEKEACWNFLEGVLKYTDLPWLCGGDFNEILWSFEKRGGFEQPSNRPCYLHNFMEKAGLIDLGYQDRASLRGLTGRMVCLFRKGSIEFWGTYHGRSHGQIIPSVTTRPSVRITIHWSWRKPCIIEIIEGSSSLKLIGPMRWRLNRLLKKAGKSKFKVRGYINGKLSFNIALPSFKNEQRKVLKQ
ncbi:hypothetical protein GBA52_010264 [Prunus armeniaca]|nr:hypothetical protein GBA52_010264 [Prunus armeniaca]